MSTCHGLHGKTALVTGAAAFISRAVAIELARRGAGGMMQMCRVLARELGRDGIRIRPEHTG